MEKYVIYYDEAGRGPLAGSVFVGLSIKLADFDDTDFDDSKKLKEEQRFALFDRIRSLEREGKIAFGVGSASARTIDSIGIVGGIKAAISTALVDLFSKMGKIPDGLAEGSLFEKTKYVLENFVSKVVLDGNSDFGLSKFVETETVIKGDGKIKMIGLSSIAAKTAKDREMIALGQLHEDGLDKYGFESHKGYGTAKHVEAIKKFGLSKVHRKTFCKSII